ncbi:hypothetical protein BD309DRAFT_957339 [Dichomitus squalens]|nr:hypothetical protein BD309DRAFT_957339 [Dichomitus squalens]
MFSATSSVVCMSAHQLVFAPGPPEEPERACQSSVQIASCYRRLDTFFESLLLAQLLFYATAAEYLSSVQGEI